MLEVRSLSCYISPKVITLKNAQKLITSLKLQGKKVGLCQGGFDLLHPGHIKHFISAKQLCDVLVVAVTSDRYVVSRKGVGRPIFTGRIRAFMIGNLDCVDFVVLTDYKGLDVINLLKPSYYIKGPDFIKKQTPGITAERDAITKIGGQMKYTNDPKLSTTEIIEYIQNQIKTPRLLLILDRDGTLIKNNDFFGKDKAWKSNLQLNDPVIGFISFLQTKYKTTKIVISNQSGVARNYFSEKKLREINEYINSKLHKKGIKIDAWSYCPDVDQEYALKHPQIYFNSKYILKKTNRKPSAELVDNILRTLHSNISQYDLVAVIGDREEDRLLAHKTKSMFIDVKGQSYEELLVKFTKENKI